MGYNKKLNMIEMPWKFDSEGKHLSSDSKNIEYNTNSPEFVKKDDYLKKLTISPGEFLKDLENKELLKDYSKEELINMILIFQEVVIEKNKIIASLKQ